MKTNDANPSLDCSLGVRMINLTGSKSAIIARLILAIVLLSLSIPAEIGSAEESDVSVLVDARHSGAVIPPGFSGLSFEVALLQPTAKGVRYFRPDNLPLINIFRTLGIQSLRIGGNTSDRDAQQLPAPVDLDSLFAFAKEARVKVIYCLQLHGGNPQMAAQTVKYIMDRYAPLVDSFSIGQEPSAYPATAVDNRPANERMGPTVEHYPYSAYATEWKKFAEIIAATVPNVKFCGPSVHNDWSWANKFIADFGCSNHVALITEHLYAGGAGNKVPTPEIGRDQMLSNNFLRTYKKLYDGFVPTAISNGLPYRLEEVNSFYNGGATNVSNTFAAALWGLDFMYWWAEHGAAGLNFHTGDRVAVGSHISESRYAAFFSTIDGCHVCPLGYGLMAFNLGAHGKIIPVTIANPKQINLSAYAVLDERGNVYLTVINKEHGANARDAKIDIRVDGESSKDGQIMYLVAPNQDVAAKTGQTLGGAEISNLGDFAGTWKTLSPTPNDGGVVLVEVNAASAAIIKLTPNG